MDQGAGLAGSRTHYSQPAGALFAPGAVGQAHQVVGLLTVRSGLQVLVSSLTLRDHHLHRAPRPADVERPFAALNASDRPLLRDPPDAAGSSRSHHSSDMGDPLVRVQTVLSVY